jgi:hypothetical protein
MWTSKLGNKYPLDVIQANDAASQKELKRLRGFRERGNHVCADCGVQDSSWASVTHGVFVCVVCSDVHRSVGTHITKMKGCTGTYLWGPDELGKMQIVGNRKADEIYGARKISPGASKEEKQRFVEDKYAKLSFASEAPSESVVCQQAKPRKCASISSSSPRNARPVPVAAAAWQSVSSSRRDAPVASKSSIPDSFFDDLFREIESSQVPRSPSKHDMAALRNGGFDDLWGEAFGKSPTTRTKVASPPALDLLA